MPTRRLPNNPSLGHLKSQAKRLQGAVQAAEPEAVALVHEFHPRAEEPATAVDLASFTRSDSLLVMARRYGFASWPQLRRHIETVDRYTRSPHLQAVGGPFRNDDDLADELLRLACLTYGSNDDPGRHAEARALLAARPDLARATIHTIAAVGDVEAARALLAERPSEARLLGGPHQWEPLLYLTYSRLDSDQPRHSPLAVARVLLDHGADPDAGTCGRACRRPSPR